MTTTVDIIRQYAEACAQDTYLDPTLTMEDLQYIAKAVENYGNAEILPYDEFYLRDRLCLCWGGKSHWRYDCGEACR